MSDEQIQAEIAELKQRVKESRQRMAQENSELAQLRAELAAEREENAKLREALEEIKRETIMPDGSRLSDEVARIMHERDEARATAFREAAQIAREHDDNDEFTIICNMIAEACERAALAAKG